MPAAGQTSRRAPRSNVQKARTDEQAQERSTPLPLEREGLAVSSSCVEKVQQDGDLPFHPIVSTDCVQAALATTLKSREFQSAPQLRAFLGFVVRATMNNEQEKLKGYTIAVEALGRPEDFNPVTDPIVRVEAARLRRRLEKYYAGSGAGDSLRIVIPKGSYAPQFHPATPCEQRKQPATGMPGLQEEATGYEADAANAEAATVARAPAGGPPATPPQQPSVPDILQAETGLVVPGPPATSDWPQKLPHAFGQAAQKPVPLPMVLLIGVLCFVAGYLAASY